jgi:hypothetical protein
MSAPREPEPRRRPHTFYLTDGLWEELDRRHHEERARVGARATKNEFVERALRLGLAALVGEGAGAEPLLAPTAVGVARAARASRRDPLEQLRRASAPGRPAPIASAADADAERAPAS